jgi:pseudaminic acid synthase
MGGPDASFSMNPKEFSKMVKSIREVEKALGKIDYNLTENQIKGKVFSRSLYVTKEIKKGERFDNSNVRSIRPGFGLHPKELKNIIGEYSNQDIEKGERFSLRFIK